MREIATGGSGPRNGVDCEVFWDWDAAYWGEGGFRSIRNCKRMRPAAE